MSEHNDWNQKIIDEFRTRDGRLGGQFAGAPLLLLTTNLVAHPRAGIEVGTESFEVDAEVASGEERDRLYATHAELYPGFKEHEQKTTRVTPVVLLTRVAS